DHHYVTDEGIAAASGKKAKADKPVKPEKQKKATVKAKKAAEPKAEKPAKKAAPAEATADEAGKPAKGRQLLINMLSRGEGATGPQMVSVTGWQDGAISGTMSKIKKLLAPQGKQIISGKDASGTLVYRIVEKEAA